MTWKKWTISQEDVNDFLDKVGHLWESFPFDNDMDPEEIAKVNYLTGEFESAATGWLQDIVGSETEIEVEDDGED